MKGLLYFNEDNEIYYKYDFQTDSINGYRINIVLSKKDKLDDLLNNTHDLSESIELSIKIAEDMRNSPEVIQELKEHKSNLEHLVKDAEYVSFDVNLDDYKDFIKESEILKTKKILFYETDDFGLEKLDKIKQIFGNTGNVYFSLNGNYEYISFDECYKTYKVLESIIGHIKKLDLSPLEKIMYAYDFAKDKVYKKEDEGSSYGTSRSITSVLFGNDIVCVGFARRLEYILKGLGIENEEVNLLNKVNQETGHMILLAHIIDDKYDIDGYYYFDPTGDSPSTSIGKIYPNSYLFFAKTREEMEKLHNNGYCYLGFPYFRDSLPYDFEKIMKNKGIDGITKDLRKSINYILSKGESDVSLSPMYFIQLSPFYGQIPTEEIVEKLEEIMPKFDTQISGDILIQALYNVRKYQYYENPQDISFDYKDLLVAYIYSKWNLDIDILGRILMSELSKKELLQYKKSLFKDYYKRNNLDRDIERVKLAKVLSKVYEKKKNEENNA